MADPQAIATHWARGDVYGLVLDALRQAGKPLETLTVEDLAPIDQYHARGLAATEELAARLPVRAGDELIDIGCGIGGPARYMARRFHCRVTGIDVTPAFVEAANQLTALLHMQEAVRAELADGQQLPMADASFDGGYTQHVTMNVADRAKFFAEAFRVLKPGACFALSEHGLGTAGTPYYPVPWSGDGSGSHLVAPEQTRRMLEDAGFVDIEIEESGAKYLAGYRLALEKFAAGNLPPLGLHVLLGSDAWDKTRNAARNIDEGRTRPILAACRKPGPRG